MRTPRSLAQEYELNPHLVRGVVEALALGRPVSRQLYILDEKEVEKARPVLERIASRRKHPTASSISA